MDCKSILVVDDSSVARRLLSNALADNGFAVAFARSGEDAMNWTTHNPPADLVITDLHMPDLDGVGLIGRLRSHRDYRRKPIFVLTSGGDQDEKQRVRDAGATAWIVKPFDTAKLVDAIRQVIN